jgi:hypothetical protein
MQSRAKVHANNVYQRRQNGDNKGLVFRQNAKTSDSLDNMPKKNGKHM